VSKRLCQLAKVLMANCHSDSEMIERSTMDEPLPIFHLHPDPVATGSVKASKKRCVCCKRARGFIYVGPVYSEEEYQDCICPWCIADGSAHMKLDASFHDDIGFFGDNLDRIPRQSIEEVAYRTPGFSGW
jgi:uncharacterized protein CbrC (UPF0167 family)